MKKDPCNRSSLSSVSYRIESDAALAADNYPLRHPNFSLPSRQLATTELEITLALNWSLLENLHRHTWRHEK